MFKKIKKNFLKTILSNFITGKIFVRDHSAGPQMKENKKIYLPYQLHWRAHLVD